VTLRVGDDAPVRHGERLFVGGWVRLSTYAALALVPYAKLV